MLIDSYQAEHELFEATRNDGRTRVCVYRPRGVQVVLGRGSQAECELFIRACLEDDAPILRRRGGGCAVVLDPGNLIVAVSQKAPGFGDNLGCFRRLNEWFIEGLKRLGVDGLQQAGISDLALGDRKVAGACLHRSRNTLLFSASLLVAPDLALITRYLRHPPREPDYRKGRSHADFLGSLAPMLADSDVNKLAGWLEEEILRVVTIASRVQ